MRIHDDAGSLVDKTGQGELVVGLYSLPIPLKVGVDSQWLQALELMFQIG
jgi:hypothetical protein